VPSPVGVWGLAPRKKKQFCTKTYAVLSKFWYFFLILEHKNFQHAKIVTSASEKVEGLSPSPKSGGLIPLPHPAPTPMLTTLPKGAFNVQRQVLERSPGELGLSKAVEYDIPIGRREESIRPVTAVGLLAVAI